MNNSTKTTTVADVLGAAADRMHKWRWAEGISGVETARQIRLAALTLTAFQGGTAMELADGALEALAAQLGAHATWLDDCDELRDLEQVTQWLRAAQAVSA